MAIWYAHEYGELVCKFVEIFICKNIMRRPISFIIHQTRNLILFSWFWIMIRERSWIIAKEGRHSVTYWTSVFSGFLCY